MSTAKRSVTRVVLARLLATFMAVSLVVSMFPAVAFAATAYNSAFTANTIPLSMVAGQRYSVRITVKNTGTAIWTAAAGYRLRAVGGSDPFTTATIIPLASSDVIRPNQSKSFVITMTAPLRNAAYTTDWQMYRGATKFGPVLTKRVTVKIAARNSLVYSYSVPTAVVTGQAFNARIVMRNIGSTRWTRSTGYRFVAVGGSDPFSAAVSIPLGTSDSIAMGGTKAFSIPMEAPDLPFTDDPNYSEFFTTDWQMYCGSTRFGAAFTTKIRVSYSEEVKLDYATMWVEMTEASHMQEIMDMARPFVEGLADGPDKAALLARLDTEQLLINSLTEYADLLTAARDAVVQAETSSSQDNVDVIQAQADVDAAQVLIDQLRPGAFQDALQTRLDAVQDIINAAIALALAKDAAHADLDQAYDTIYAPVESDYSAEKWGDLLAARSAGHADIDATTDLAGVADALSDALAAMDAVKTLAEELVDARIAAHAALLAARNAYDPDDYSPEKWGDLVAAHEAGDAAIDAAASIPDVLTAEADAEAAMDAMLTLEEEAAIALQDAKDAAHATLDAVRSTYEAKRGDYTQGNWNAVVAAYNIGGYAIDAAATIPDVLAAESYAETSMAAIMTILQTYKADKQDDLAGKYYDYVETDYSTVGWAALTAAYEAGSDAIAAAANKDEVDAALAAAEAAMAAVPDRAHDLPGVIAEDRAALAAAYGDYDSDDYSTEKWTELTNARDTADATIANATAISDADSALAEGLNDMAEVETLAQQLAAAQVDAHADLDAAYTTYTLHESDYSADNWQILTAAYYGGSDAIDEATSIPEANAALSDALAAMDDVLTQAETLDSITLDTTGAKTSYFVGEELDITGLVVTGHYADGSSKAEAITAANVSGFDSSAAAAGQELTVTMGGQTATYAVDIVEPTLDSITLDTTGVKTSYFVGEELDITGLIVTGHYSDGSSKAEAITAANVSGFDSSAAAAGQELTVTVGGQTATYTINIVEP